VASAKLRFQPTAFTATSDTQGVSEDQDVRTGAADFRSTDCFPGASTIRATPITTKVATPSSSRRAIQLRDAALPSRKGEQNWITQQKRSGCDALRGCARQAVEKRCHRYRRCSRIILNNLIVTPRTTPAIPDRHRSVRFGSYRIDWLHGGVPQRCRTPLTSVARRAAGLW
jgi:hypothetical protein